MTQDIEPILQVLLNILQGIPLTDPELQLLQSWLMEDALHEVLLDEICNKRNWKKECSLEGVRARIIEMLENN